MSPYEDGSVVDDQTGLPNRAGWSALLEAEEQRARRHGGVHGIVLIAVEAPLAAAEAVEEVAMAITEAVRDTDFLARVDHGTFAVLALHCDSLDTVVSRIREVLGRPELPPLARVEASVAYGDLQAAWEALAAGTRRESSAAPTRYVAFLPRPPLNLN